MRRMRTLTLTPKALAALGVCEMVEVPLVDVAWRDERRDRRDGQAR